MNFEDLMNEVNNYERPKTPKRLFLTEGQKQFIAAALKKEISSSQMTKLWNKVDGWRKISMTSMKTRINLFKGVQNEDQ
ncbi:MAG: hypothetical protein WC451_05325 [Patescibacteria group bacterium]|jgi:hypothetical protein